MKLSTLILWLALFLLTCVSAQASRKLIDDHDVSYSESNSERGETRVPYKEADSALELRKLRRVGIGLQAAGSLGLGGAELELAFSPQWSMGVGYGGGSGFQAVAFQGKYVIAGDWLMPYLSFGYARWINSGANGPIDKTTPSILGDRLLTTDEKAKGEFQKNLLYPGIGLQYMQLTGDWAGTSVYAELTVLLDLGQFVAAPTGAIGLLYYF